MKAGNKFRWLVSGALALLLASGGAAYAQHGGGGGGGSHFSGGGGGGGFHGGGGGFHGGVSHYGVARGGYGYRGGYGGYRGGYYGGWRGGYGGWGYGGWGYGALGYGLFFGALPYAYSTYWWGGIPYYYADNNYYQWDAGSNAYETVAPPPQVEAQATQANQGSAPMQGSAQGAPGAPGGQSELFAYPRTNQSAQQQAKDRTECGEWATKQAQNHQDHMRAESACLEGRGYSVR